MKEYKAIIWIGDRLGHRACCVFAETSEDAKKKLEAQYGEGRVYYVQHDEDEANRARFVARGAIAPEDGTVKAYRAIIWTGNDQLGHRVCILAENAEEAKKKLEAEYGTGHVYTVWNEEDAKKPR